MSTFQPNGPLRDATNDINRMPTKSAPASPLKGAALPHEPITRSADEQYLHPSTAGSQDNSVATSQQLVPNSTAPPTTPGSMPEYGQEILQHFLLRERTMMRNAGYLSNQPEVTERMRAILLDWMVDVQIKFKLHPETYFLAVDIIDRYLGGNQVSRARLQLVGVVATLLAAKHEEIWPPEVKDCIYIAANTYDREEILHCEREVSNFLQFRLAVPTSYPIMSFLLDTLEAPNKLKYTALMFLETSAIDYNSLRFLPSVNACAAILLANLTCQPDSPAEAWPALIEQQTRIDYATVAQCAESMLAGAHQVLAEGGRYKASARKFGSSRYLAVASQKLPTQVPPTQH